MDSEHTPAFSLWCNGAPLPQQYIPFGSPFNRAKTQWAFSHLNNKSSIARKRAIGYSRFLVLVTELEGHIPSEEEQISYARILYACNFIFGFYWKGKLLHRYELLTP